MEWKRRPATRIEITIKNMIPDFSVFGLNLVCLKTPNNWNCIKKFPTYSNKLGAVSIH